MNKLLGDQQILSFKTKGAGGISFWWLDVFMSGKILFEVIFNRKLDFYACYVLEHASFLIYVLRHCGTRAIRLRNPDLCFQFLFRLIVCKNTLSYHSIRSM